MIATVEQLAFLQEVIHLIATLSLTGSRAPEDMPRPNLVGMIQADGRHYLCNGFHRVLVVARYTLRLVADVQCSLSDRILCGHADGAFVCMARLRLDAADRHHHAAGAVAPIRADRQVAQDVGCGCHLAGTGNLDLGSESAADETVVNKDQTIDQRSAYGIRKLKRSRTGSALGAIHGNEIRQDSRFEHRLAHAQEFASLADANLETRRFAATKPAEFSDEIAQPPG